MILFLILQNSWVIKTRKGDGKYTTPCGFPCSLSSISNKWPFSILQNSWPIKTRKGDGKVHNSMAFHAHYPYRRIRHVPFFHQKEIIDMFSSFGGSRAFGSVTLPSLLMPSPWYVLSYMLHSMQSVACTCRPYCGPSGRARQATGQRFVQWFHQYQHQCLQLFFLKKNNWLDQTRMIFEVMSFSIALVFFLTRVLILMPIAVV